MDLKIECPGLETPQLLLAFFSTSWSYFFYYGKCLGNCKKYSFANGKKLFAIWQRFFFLFELYPNGKKNPDQIRKFSHICNFFAIWTFAIIEEIASALVPGWEKFIFSFSPLVS